MAQIRKSNRISHPSVRLSFLNEVFTMISEECEKNLYSYEDIMLDIDKNKWIDVMRTEMDLTCFNDVWTLANPSIRIKTIGCKWIYKRKRGLDGKVETYKARLVTKGYNRKKIIDYDETFSLVVMLKSIRIILAIVAYNDYEIWKMDIQIVFSNGYLAKETYMNQLRALYLKGKNTKYESLKNSFMV